MAKYVGYKRPKDTKKTIRHLLVYLRHAQMVLFVWLPCWYLSVPEPILREHIF